MSRRSSLASPIPPREWLNTDEAAAWIGVSAKTIQRAKAAGKLSAKKREERGAPDYYRISDLRAWVESWEDA